MKRTAPAADRNREPILDALRELLGPGARVLEVGSGTGQHAQFFTENMPGWIWQPTDLDPANLASVEAHRAEVNRDNFLPPLRLDAASSKWPSGPFDAVFSAIGLIDGAARMLNPSALLILYGPFRFSGSFTADSNAAFDARLRGEDPSWGVRDVDDLQREALARGFLAPRVVPMPANNHVLVFERAD
jgi:SAM-dependent methyltransferase